MEAILKIKDIYVWKNKKNYGKVKEFSQWKKSMYPVCVMCCVILFRIIGNNIGYDTNSNWYEITLYIFHYFLIS